MCRRLREVEKDRAAVDQRRLHRFAHDLNDAALAGVEAVSGQPVLPELDAADDAFVLDDGSAAVRGGALGDADEVAFVGDAGVGLLVFEVADARGGGGQGAGELMRRRLVLVSPIQVESIETPSTALLCPLLVCSLAATDGRANPSVRRCQPNNRRAPRTMPPMPTNAPAMAPA